MKLVPNIIILLLLFACVCEIQKYSTRYKQRYIYFENLEFPDMYMFNVIITHSLDLELI